MWLSSGGSTSAVENSEQLLRVLGVATEAHIHLVSTYARLLVAVVKDLLLIDHVELVHLLLKGAVVLLGLPNEVVHQSPFKVIHILAVRPRHLFVVVLDHNCISRTHYLLVRMTLQGRRWFAR